MQQRCHPRNILSAFILLTIFQFPLAAFSEQIKCSQILSSRKTRPVQSSASRFESLVTIKPRIGLETETARVNENGQILIPPSTQLRQAITSQILQFWQKHLGGTVSRSQDGSQQLKLGSDQAGSFRVDEDWASDNREADAFEVVTPPLTDVQLSKYIERYDDFIRENQLGPGLKTSQQFNIELRELIPGFSLSDQPSSKLGISYASIKKANVSKVVDLYLYMEAHTLEFYAALSPKRLGDLVNYFQVPMIFENVELLKELAQMPAADRTYENVRQVFIKYNDKETEVTRYAPNKNGRTEWKYRPFNIRKFFEPDQNRLTWVYPALEVRIPDTVKESSELTKIRDFIYAVFNKGANETTAPEAFDGIYSRYRDFMARVRTRLPFQKAIRLLNQDLTAQVYTGDFNLRYNKFIDSLGLDRTIYTAFKGSEPASFVSQSYQIYNQIGPRREFQYAGRTVVVPELKTNPELWSGFSFGLECEFAPSAELEANLIKLPFVGQRISRESTGNHEIQTKPTTDPQELLIQLQLLRDVVGDNLKGFHFNQRIDKSIYDQIPKQRMDAWLGRIGDWISTLRASYRQPLFAFGTRTNNRMRVDTPNGWIADDKAQYRGTMRVYFVGDKVNIETRGLMSGLYKQNELEPDQIAVAMLLTMNGLTNPKLVEGQYLGRVVSEMTDPEQDLLKNQLAYASSQKKSLDDLPHKIEDLMKVFRDPDLMLLPLVGLEYSPMLSSHDIKRIQDATFKWQHEVWTMLNDASLSKEDLSKKFLESLKSWTRDSRIEHAIFDTLLMRPAPGATWAMLNLPHPSLHSSYLRKMTSLQNTPRAKASLDLLISTWFKRDKKSFIEAAKQLPATSRQQIIATISQYESSQAVSSLSKSLGFESNKAKSPKEDGILTNLMSFLGLDSKEALTASSGWSRTRENDTQISADLPAESVVPEDHTSVVEPVARRVLDPAGQARQQIERNARLTLESIEHVASQAAELEQQLNSGALNKSRYAESMTTIFAELKALDLKSYAEAGLTESYSITTMKNGLIRALVKAIEIQSQDRPYIPPDKKSYMKAMPKVVLTRIEKLQLLSNLLGKNKHELAKIFIEKFDDLFVATFNGNALNLIGECARYTDTTLGSMSPRYSIHSSKFEPIDPIYEEVLLNYVLLVKGIWPLLSEVNSPQKQAFIDAQSKIFSVFPNTTLASNSNVITTAVSVLGAEKVASILYHKFIYENRSGGGFWSSGSSSRSTYKGSDPNTIKKSVEDLNSTLQLAGISENTRTSWVTQALLSALVEQHTPDIPYLEYLISYSRALPHPLSYYATPEIKQKLSSLRDAYRARSEQSRMWDGVQLRIYGQAARLIEQIK